ncbi:DUF397 domain-containing protein [Streptomyces sp. NPDC053720]|uniref:DUF397 domain-containing protein n=1 Tax=Streptomyces sp. NPDC053720 TaxID=3154855 RepID=UPI00342EC217
MTGNLRSGAAAGNPAGAPIDSGADSPSCEAALWRKSSYSGQGGDCVEVADGVSGFVPVRDSRHACGPVVAFSGRSRPAFIADVKAARDAR